MADTRVKLVLASASPRRLMLLERMGLAPDLLNPTDLDETPKRRETPRRLSIRLAEEKDAWYLNAAQYRDKTGSSGDEVGREFDLVGKFDLPQGNSIQVGFGHFWPDEFAADLASGKEANWVFVEWMYTFSTAIL